MKTTTFLSCFFSCLLFFLACSDGSETTEIPSTEEPATIPAPERAQPVFDGLDASSTKPSPDGEASDEDTEVAESTEDTETAIEDPDSSPLEEAADGESLSDGKDSDNGSGTEPLDGFVDEDGDEPLPEEGDGFEEEEETSGETTVITAASCFSDIASPDVEAPDYDQFEGLIVGSHCKGSNHQDIQGVEKIVVIGDSITQGSPNDIHPTCIDTAHFYRNLLAEWLAGEFGVDQGNLFDWGSWKTYNCAYNGTAALTHSGDFSNCSKWGAKTDDLIEGGNQLPDCLDDFPDFGSEKTTLFFFTIGGNDVGSINQAGFEASPEEVAAGYPEAWALAQSTIVYLEEAVAWLKDPANFPNGSYVVFGTPYEFTDATGDTEACEPEAIDVPLIGPIKLQDLGIDLAEIAGFGPWENPAEQFAIVNYLLEEYVRIAVQYQADVVFTAEAFCGHGWVATGPNADASNPCYRGPDAELWFDKSCYHPSEAGHAALFELFKTVIQE